MATRDLNPDSLGRVVCRSLRPGWKSNWLGASVMGGCGPCPIFKYTLEFSLRLKKTKENLSHGSSKLQRTFHCVDFAVFYWTSSTGLLFSVAFC